MFKHKFENYFEKEVRINNHLIISSVLNNNHQHACGLISRNSTLD